MATRSPRCTRVSTCGKTTSLSDRLLRFGLKPVVFVISLAPAVGALWLARASFFPDPIAPPPGWLITVSPNPLSDITLETGTWAIRFVCITLALTPLRRLSGWNGFTRFRRMAGLFAFFYGSLHFLTYVIADRYAGLDLTNGFVSLAVANALVKSVGEDIYKRPFITIGFAAWLTMLPLALTSTTGWIRRLGGRKWNLLHRLVYATGALAVVHYWWLVKSDISRPRNYAIVVALLLGFRVYWSRMRSVRPRPVLAHK
jgi:methionine sulfoxide reductase heme-binding subunit